MKRKTTWMLMFIGCVIAWVVIIVITLVMLEIIKYYWVYF